MFDRPGKPSLDKDSPNTYYEDDIRYTLQMCQWVLKSIGMWSPIYGFATVNGKITSVILIVVCFSTLCFVLFPISHFTFFREQEAGVKMMMFGPLGFCITTIIKYCYIGLKASTFERCIKHVENDWRMIDDPVHRSIMLRNVTLSRHLTTICALFLYSGGLLYNGVLPLLSKTTIGNITSRTLAYPGYDLLFDVTTNPTYGIIFSFHCFYAFVGHNITITACNLAATFVAHACGQIEIQMHRLKSVVQLHMTQSPHSEDPLAIIVKDHARILRFCQCVEEVLREICLMELIFSTLIICLLEYYCIMEWTNSDATAILAYCFLLISFTFNILIFCYIGELLVDQGGKIGGACYAIDWYNLPSNKARSLVLLIMMSKSPPKLTAGKMFDLSLTTFSSVLKSSLAYLNLLRTVTE